MNILTDALPDSVTIGGESYSMHTDFRRWAAFEIIMTDGRRDDAEKIAAILKMYAKKLPPKMDSAIHAAVAFFAGGKETVEQPQGKEARPQKRIYSFEHDADAIYASFCAAYGIDLCSANLHWYQFRALFLGLPEDTKIMQIMGYRSTDLAKIKDKKQKDFYRKMKRIYRLPDMRSDEERERDMMQAFNGFF